MNSDSPHSTRPRGRAYFAPRLKLPPAPVALSVALRLSIAIVLVSLAAFFNLRIDRLLGGHAPFLLFFSAVILSTWFGGLGAGLLAVFLSAAFSLAFSAAIPAPSLNAGSGTTWMGTSWIATETVLFVLESVVIVLLIYTMRRAQSQSAARSRALQTSEDRYRRVLDAAFEGIWILDNQGHVTYSNEHLATMLGYSNEELQGALLYDFIPPEERDAAMERFRQRSEGVRAQYEARLLRKDGSPVWTLVSSTPLRDEFGQFQGSLAMLTDISERKHFEQVLQQSEERYRAFVRQSSEAIWRFELDEPLDCALPVETQIEHCLHHIAIAECNDAMAQMLHRENADALVGARLHDIMPISEQNVTYLRDFILAGYRLMEAPAQKTDDSGYSQYFETNLIGIREDGFLRRVWGMRRDVTAQREAEIQRAVALQREHEARLAAEEAHQEAQSASRAKDEFLATLSHELRTPLNAILGWAQLLGDQKLDEETTVYALAAIERNAKLQAQLIEDLLDISRLTMGRMEIEQEPVLVREFVQAAIQTVTPAARAKNIHIEYSNACDELHPVCGDVQRLQQIAWNLLSNAIKFTPENGQIRITQSCDGEHIKVEFSDNGPGIAPEFLPHIFEAFRQADSSNTRSHGGVGLGLSIVKTLIDLHGGTVEAHSDGAGNGATFIVELPLYHAPTAS